MRGLVLGDARAGEVAVGDARLGSAASWVMRGSEKLNDNDTATGEAEAIGV